jgi:GNAT superfamily N-acetyltransferase
MHDIERIDLNDARLEGLANAARAEGFSHINRLIENWKNGSNRFDRHGEALFGAFDRRDIIAVGGLNRDPYLDDPRIGRVRRLYVLPSHRRAGVGRALVREIIDHARGAFKIVRVRAATGDAPLFYDSIGFNRAEGPEVSHLLQFE